MLEHSRRQPREIDFARYLLDFAGLKLPRFVQAVIYGSQNQIFQHVHIFWIYYVRFNLDLLNLLVAVYHNGNNSAAGRTLHRLFFQFCLDLSQIFLHLLDLAHHLLHVHPHIKTTSKLF